jgi:hypothetical protein
VLGHYAFFPASPWWLTLFPSKWSSLGMRFLLGNPLISHRTIPNHTYPFPSLFPFVSLSLGILGCIDPRRGCPSFYGKKGLKAQRGWYWLKDKIHIRTFHMLHLGITQERNKMLIFEQKGTHDITKKCLKGRLKDRRSHHDPTYHIHVYLVV